VRPLGLSQYRPDAPIVLTSRASWNFVAKKSDYKLTGETKTYEDKGESGNPTYRVFCGDCAR
jgi:hypothetical protein